MKKILISSAIILFLGSCTLNQTQEKSVFTACLGYNAVLQETDTALNTGKITVAKAISIENNLLPFKAFCNGTQPTNSTAVISNINAAVLNASKELK